MHEFIASLIARIDAPDPESIGCSLIDASESIRIWKLFGGDPPRRPGRSISGPFSADGPYPRIEREDARAVGRALERFVEAHMDGPHATSAVHGLACLADPSTKPLLLRTLRSSVGRDAKLMFQTMLALELLDEPLFPAGAMSRSITDVARNEYCARAYLATLDGS